MRLASDACGARISRVVLDRIDSVVERDRSWIMAGTRSAGHQHPLFSYHHQRRYEEPLLWIADALGCAWARGGEMKTMVRRHVDVVDV
ncbi:hypothetical protein [Aeromicrobium sp.]|uniref:hypothetical protein n=1 Tax=Aeromicrobium sp. TaxID=1871063 RepID=UPI0028ADFB15|nr:hypothetical protein [Aeromicrobium sp.]